MAAEGSRPGPPPRRTTGIEALVIATFGVLGWGAGARPLSDNSLFVHLRTGIDLVRTGHIPRSDPYSFTAHGHPWIVQSWLASLIYGLTYRAGGWAFGSGRAVHLLVLLDGLLMAALAIAVARLARTGSGPRTMVSAGIAVTLGGLYWSPRPLLIGLLCFVAFIAVVERPANPLWLVPIMWIWVNSHGSFPLGVAWLGLRCLGEALDGRRVPRERRGAVIVTVAGLVAAAINPLGPRLLLFPLVVEEKAPAFRHIIEWASPNFQASDGRLAALLIGMAIVVLTRRAMRWADVLPAALFLVLGLYSLRNLASLAVVLAPVLGNALRIEPARGAAAEQSQLLNRTAAVALVLVIIAIGARSLLGTGFDLTTYPAAAEKWMAANDLVGHQRRVVAQDYVGCYLILLHGQDGRVFVDDRFDMYPLAVSADYLSLFHGDQGATAVVDRYRPAAVLWQKSLPLVPELEATGKWRISYQDQTWAVLTPT